MEQRGHPRSVGRAGDAEIRLDQPVDVRAEDGRIVKLRPARYMIGSLVAGMTDENRQDPVDMGEPAGQDVW